MNGRLNANPEPASQVEEPRGLPELLRQVIEGFRLGRAALGLSHYDLACYVARGYADGMVTGVTRAFDQALEEVLRVIDPAPGGRMIGRLLDV